MIFINFIIHIYTYQVLIPDLWSIILITISFDILLFAFILIVGELPLEELLSFLVYRILFTYSLSLLLNSFDFGFYVEVLVLAIVFDSLLNMKSSLDPLLFYLASFSLFSSKYFSFHRLSSSSFSYPFLDLIISNSRSFCFLSCI